MKLRSRIINEYLFEQGGIVLKKQTKNSSDKKKPKKITKAKLKKMKGGVMASESYPMCPAPVPDYPGTT